PPFPYTTLFRSPLHHVPVAVTGDRVAALEHPRRVEGPQPGGRRVEPPALGPDEAAAGGRQRALAPVARRDRLLDRPGAELLGPYPVALHGSLLARQRRRRTAPRAAGAIAALPQRERTVRAGVVHDPARHVVQAVDELHHPLDQHLGGRGRRLARSVHHLVDHAT